MDTYQYTWQIDIITNLRHTKKIEIVVEGNSLENATETLMFIILQVSRYGIPCYNFDSGNNNYSLAPLQKHNNFREYYEISYNFIDKINSTKPCIKFNNKIHKCPEFNVNAKPFIPSTLY